MEYINIATKLFVGLALVLIIVRMMGNKPLSQVGPIDIFFVIVFADSIVEAAFAKDKHAGHLIFTLLFWALLIWALDTFTSRTSRNERMIDGQPKLVIQDGEPIREVLDDEKISDTELKALLRNEGIWDIKEVELGILELNGKLNCKRYSQ